jgi:membrane associated rhomboid family serine protease
MAELSVQSLETVLRQVADAAPDPWYPKLYAESSGVPRDDLDAPLEKLRLANLIRLTEWVQGRGQGYVLTPEGMQALKEGKTQAYIRDGAAARPMPFPKPRQNPRWSAWDRGEEIREVFLNPPNAVVAKAILFVNVLLFLAGLYAASQANVPANLYLYSSGLNEQQAIALVRVKLEFGALVGDDLILGQWWRLLTHCFVHHGLLHIIMNMYALYALSKYLEPMWGHVRFSIVYLISGWGGGCVAMIFSPMGLLGGASGALCGLIAAEAVWMVLNRAYLPGPLFSAWMRNMVMNTILIVIISMLPQVSASAHFGGAAAGAIVAVLLHIQRYGLGVARWLALVAIPLIPLASLGALLQAMKSQPQWVQIRERFQADTAREELRHFRERYNRDAASADTTARNAYADAYDVIKNHPSRRAPEKIERGIDILTQARTELGEAIQKLSAGSAYRESDAEELRQTVLEYLQAQADLLSLCERFLRDNQNLVNANEKALQEQKNKVDELRKRLFHRQ